MTNTKVEIAKGVLAALDAKEIQASIVYYLQPRDGGGYRTCALGAMYVAAMKMGLVDEIPGLNVHDEILDGLLQFFDKDQLELIECAYEGDPDFASYDADKRLVKNAVNFGLEYLDDEERMRAIMEAVAGDEGMFRP